MRRLPRGQPARADSAVSFTQGPHRSHARSTRQDHQGRCRTHARLPKCPGGRPRQIPVERRGQRRTQQGRSHRPRVPLHRLSQVPRPRRLPRGRAALGHVERDQFEHGRVRLESPPRRVSGTRRQHRNGELRGPHRHCRRRGLHRRHQLRQEAPCLRQVNRQALVGSDAPLFRQCHAHHLHGEGPPICGSLRQWRQG